MTTAYASNFFREVTHRTFGKILLSLPTPMLNLLALLYTRFLKAGKPDPEMLPFLSNVAKGCTVLEVGSNTGRFTRLLSERVGEHGLVIACEPNPIAFLILKQYLRHCGNTVLLNVGLGATLDTVQVLTMQGPADSAASICSLSKENALRIQCHFTTLDQLVLSLRLQKLDIIIIDAEGAEIEVLEGARDTLNSMMPWVLIELHPNVRNNVVEEVIDKLAAYRYEGAIFSVDSETATYLFRSHL